MNHIRAAMVIARAQDAATPHSSTAVAAFDKYSDQQRFNSGRSDLARRFEPTERRTREGFIRLARAIGGRQRSLLVDIDDNAVRRERHEGGCRLSDNSS